MINFIGMGISAIAGAVGNYFRHKAEVVQAKRTVEIAKIEAQAEVARHAHEIDRANMDADALTVLENKYTYLDDILSYMLIGFSIYSVMYPKEAMEAIKVFAEYPTWLMILYVGMYVSRLAIRGMFNPIGKMLGRK